MIVNTNNHYQQLVDMGLSNREIAEAFILPSEISEEEQEELSKEFSEYLKTIKRNSLYEDSEGIFID